MRRILSSGTSKNLLLSILFVALGNYRFHLGLIDTYGLGSEILPALASVVVVNLLVTFVLVSLIDFMVPLGILLVSLVVASSAYFMDHYNVTIDSQMILNVLKTDLREVRDLITFGLLLYLTVIPALTYLIVSRLRNKRLRPLQEIKILLRNFGLALASILVILFSFNTFYASFLREHKPLRFSSNPGFPLYSAFSLGKDFFKNSNQEFKVLEANPAIAAEDMDRDLVVIVVGETARAQNFSIHGYTRDTNPELSKEEIYPLNRMMSCGTSTAVSVPCLFSILPPNDFNVSESPYTQNLLDLLVATTGVDVLWRDNNSDSKGVATRIEYEDFRTPSNNSVCDIECRDEGMLKGLDSYVNKSTKKDIVIVLHQMGNHGPAYYKRYPKSFQKFLPICETAELEKCSKEQIVNSYDNAILYTDYFLAKTIQFLKQYDKKFETALIYVSDHGESLGEHGVYLHGLPKSIAPDEQVHVGSFVWLGTNTKTHHNTTGLKAKKDQDINHHYIPQTVMGFLEIKNQLYRPEMDLFK